MSGGFFNYKQYELEHIADDIEELIRDGDYSKETIEKFKLTVALLRTTKAYVHRIDWLVSCDDSEETFHERLEEDIRRL